MPRLAHVTGVYELPAELQVTPSCFAKSFPVKVGSFTGTVTLPRPEWRDERPHFVAPAMDPNVEPYIRQIVDAKHGWEAFDYWGRVSRYNPSERKILRAHLGAILLTCKLDPAAITYSDYLHGRGHPQGSAIQELFQRIDDWFEQIRTWVETALDQDADPHHALLAPRLQAAGLHVLTVEGSTVSLPAHASRIFATLSTYEPLSLSLLRKIMQRVNAGSVPSDAQLFLRDSRAELRRGRYRRAVIDAGSATEITLADFNQRVTRVTIPLRGATLGWYATQSAIVAQAHLPAHIMADLVTIRNSAIHHNRIPTQTEAARAVALAKQVVDRLDPLPL